MLKYKIDYKMIYYYKKMHDIISVKKIDLYKGSKKLKLLNRIILLKQIN